MVDEFPNLRIITISVEPGKEVEVNYEGFAHWEAEAALIRAGMLVHFNELDDEGVNMGGTITFTADPEDDDETGD